MLLITTNVNSYQFKAYAAIIGRIIENDNDKTDDVNNTGTNTTVLVGHRMYYWIPKYIFHTSFDTFPKASLPAKWNSSHIILVVTANRVAASVLISRNFIEPRRKCIFSLENWSYQSSIPIAGLYLFPYWEKRFQSE